MSSKPIVPDEFASDESTSPELRVVESAPQVESRASESSETMNAETQLKSILGDVLGLNTADAEAMTAESGLFGHLPELDSMAVAGLLTEIEDRFDIVIEDDDVDGEMLETFGGLLTFVEAKIAEA